MLNRLEAEACADRFISLDSREFPQSGDAAALARAEGWLESDAGADTESIHDGAVGEGTEGGDLVGMDFASEDLRGGNTDQDDPNQESHHA